MKKLVAIVITAALLVLAAVGIPAYMNRRQYSLSESDQEEKGIFSQHVLGISSRPETVYTLYSSGQCIGVVHNHKKIDDYLKSVYREKYAEAYPSSSIHLADGLRLERNDTFLIWSDADDAIVQWLDQNNGAALEAYEIAFSNDSGIYARIYVSELSIYERALKRYLSFFADTHYLNRLMNGETMSDPVSYGSTVTGISIAETISTLRSNASPDEIYTNEDDVLEYLEYGNNNNKSYYTVQPGDTLEGIGEKNGGLSAAQLVNINSDILKSTEDQPKAGEKLCVTYFESPITVQVYRSRLVKEPLPFQTEYLEGITTSTDRTIVQNGSDGSQNVLYQETWVNGVLESGRLVSSALSMKPASQIKIVNDESEKSAGSGGWQIPVDHSEITCTWGCRAGYEAVSFKNDYDAWGSVYAADNGVIEGSGYDDENGNWIEINHQNGLHSWYAHLQEPSSLSIGTTVKKGDVIGQIGTTGDAAYPHLKFWLEDDDGNHLNPLEQEGFPDCPNS